tara:strand:+ start:2759 stop:3040 length:282 start_codon:yes stop_codon:yes gene_type:complete
MIEKILKIKEKIENNKNLSEKEIDEIVNNKNYIIVYEFTNKIGHLTLFGKNKLVKVYKDEILEEIFLWLFCNNTYFDMPIKEHEKITSKNVLV